MKVELVDKMGTDLSVVNAARVSYAKYKDSFEDKDEKLFDEKNILSFPLCTIIYYPHVDNLKGGELLLGNDKILPKTNRMVIFASGISHNVENFTGDRISMMVNPWAKSITSKVYESNF